MKKFLCIFVTCCILFAGLSLPLFAIDGENEEISSEPENVLGDALTYVCNYDAEKKRVMLSGSLNNEIFSDHGGWSICVYAVPTGTSEYDVIEDPDSKPLAETLISKKFEFSLKADEIRYRYSRYAIFLRSPDGEMVLASKAQYPEVKYSEKVAEGMRNYKGISADFSSFVTDIDAGTLILLLRLIAVQNVFEIIGGGGLSLGSGDADDVQLLRGVLVVQIGQRGHGAAHICHQNTG